MGGAWSGLMATVRPPLSPPPSARPFHSFAAPRTARPALCRTAAPLARCPPSLLHSGCCAGLTADVASLAARTAAATAATSAPIGGAPRTPGRGRSSRPCARRAEVRRNGGANGAQAAALALGVPFGERLEVGSVRRRKTRKMTGCGSTCARRACAEREAQLATRRVPPLLVCWPRSRGQMAGPD